jgi:hypothetical protein
LVIILENELLKKLGNREISKAQLSRLVETDFGLLPILFDCTASPEASIRYGCASVLMDLTAKHQDLLIPYMDRFVALLDSNYRILTWNSLAAIANLTARDVDRKFDAIFDKYYGFLGSEYMVTLANTVTNSAKIAVNKPYLADTIAAELVKVQKLKTTPHLTEESKPIIAQKAIETFKTLIGYTQKKAELIEFAKKHQDSPRFSLKKEAQKFIKKRQ